MGQAGALELGAWRARLAARLSQTGLLRAELAAQAEPGRPDIRVS